MNYQVYPYVIDFKCKSIQITEFLIKQDLDVIFDDNFKFGTITLNRSKSIDFLTYFKLIKNKILRFELQDLQNIIILMAQFVKQLIQNNLNLDVNQKWNQMIIQLDCQGAFQRVILLNLQEEICHNTTLFRSIVSQMAHLLTLQEQYHKSVRKLVDQIIQNNFTNQEKMFQKKNPEKNRDILNNQMNAAIRIFEDNKDQNFQLSILDIRCSLSIKTASFMKILLDQNHTSNSLKLTNIDQTVQFWLIERLRQQMKSMNRQFQKNMKTQSQIHEWFYNLDDKQKLDEFILKYLQIIGFFDCSDFEQEVIVQQFQIHTQSFLQKLYLSKVQPTTLDEYLKKLVILECIERSCKQRDFDVENINNQKAKIDQIFDINQILNINTPQNLQEIEAEKSLNKAIVQYINQIQQELIIFLKQYGYFENIYQFTKISQNIDQINDFIKGQFVIIINKNFQQNVNILEIPINIKQSFPQSLRIITKLALEQTLLFNIDNKSPQLNEYLTQLKSIRKVLIQNLKQIQLLGYTYSNPLIDFCIENLGKQLKEKYLPNRKYLVQFMVDSWLNWIDQQIVKKQITTLEQLEQINKDTFIHFIQKQGQQLLSEEIKKQIDLIVDKICSQLNI